MLILSSSMISQKDHVAARHVSAKIDIICEKREASSFAVQQLSVLLLLLFVMTKCRNVKYIAA